MASHSGTLFSSSQRRKQVPTPPGTGAGRTCACAPWCTAQCGGRARGALAPLTHAPPHPLRALQDDERFNLSGQEYLERYHIPVYVSDSIRTILDAREERPLETALKYFNSVLQVLPGAACAAVRAVRQMPALRGVTVATPVMTSSVDTRAGQPRAAARV